MSRLLKEDLKKGAILICKNHIVKFDWNTTLSKKGFPLYDKFFDINKRIPFVFGNTYEVLENYKTSVGLLFLKDLSTGEEGVNYLNTIISNLELDSPAPLDKDLIIYEESDFKLNDGEEFILVLKENPNLVYKTIKDKYYDQYPEYKDKDDVVCNTLVLNKKVGCRKKLKNVQSFIGFLNNASGNLDLYRWGDFFKTNPSKEREFHLKTLDNLNEWIGGPKVDFDFDKLELRKYFKKTRKISSVAVNFDIVSYLNKFDELFRLTYFYGPAVSNVIGQIIEENKEKEYPFIFSSKFDHNKFKNRRDVPNDKDIYLDLAIKNSGLKKKDVFWQNHNGFSAIAFKTEEELNKFKSIYKKEDLKLIQTININDLNVIINLENIKQYYKKNIKKMENI